jgi:F-type H+-transporting ATPase subunit delta
MSALARRYAAAVVAAMDETGDLSGVDALLLGLSAARDLYATCAELRELLHNPAFKSQRDAVLMRAIAGLELVPPAKNLVRLLAERDRMALLDQVVLEVEAIADERAVRARVIVTTATSLTDAHVRRIAAAFARRLGRQILVRTVVDPEILGGLVFRVGDLTIDSSLRRQLTILRERLEQ